MLFSSVTMQNARAARQAHHRTMFRERAAWALLKIGPAASEAIPVLKSVSETAPARLRKLCQNAIGEIGIGVGAAGQRAA